MNMNESQTYAYSKAERVLLAVALLLGIVFDRFVTNNIVKGFSAYWIVYLLVLYCYRFNSLKKNIVAWILACFTLLLCMWNFIFQEGSDYGVLNFLVIPCVLMVHAVYSTGQFKMKDVYGLFCEWIHGWFIKPFSGIPKFAGALQSMFMGSNYTTLKKVMIGLGISIPVLIVIVPLLCSADMVVNYYLGSLIENIDIDEIIFHGIIIIILTLTMFSFIWNICYAQIKPIKPVQNIRLDSLISSIVLGVILVCYCLFCLVQFTYLFAGTGLPNNLTYSAYAREGFWQLIAVAGINLFIFAIVLTYAGQTKPLRLMLFTLIACTLMMQISAFVRLKLYIDVFGWTWLRLLAMWFVFYLFVVLGLCIVRMMREKLPLVAVGFLVLLVWFTALGYMNPDAFIANHNRGRADVPQSVVSEE